MPCLEHLPSELIENVLSHLALDDIRDFCLASHGLATISTHHFHSFLRCKHVDLTEPSLYNFTQATKPGQIGSFVTHLVLVGIVNNPKWLTRRIKHPTDGHKCDDSVSPEGQAKARADLDLLMQCQRDYETMRQLGLDVTLLAEAFTNLMAPSHNGDLGSNPSRWTWWYTVSTPTEGLPQSMAAAGRLSGRPQRRHSTLQCAHWQQVKCRSRKWTFTAIFPAAV
ncbi:hypothetical protein BDW74DRAFT_172924 [Aspergillus multicolor]|uniref:uncharacterized protein n=1 Tax=Aspergillus multicolor TaxID=41759 RepID=UPI003CCD6EB9